MKESHHCKNRTLGKSSESCYEKVTTVQVFLLSYASAGDHIHLLLNHFSATFTKTTIMKRSLVVTQAAVTIFCAYILCSFVDTGL